MMDELFGLRVDDLSFGAEVDADVARRLDTAAVEAARVARDYEEMMQTKGWQHLERTLEQQIVLRLNGGLLQPIGEREVSKVEFHKGEMVGMLFAKRLPRLVVETAKAHLRERKGNGNGGHN